MSMPDSKSPEDAKAARPAGLAWTIIVPALAYAVPVLAFILDYKYFGPIVRFGPFIVWMAAALGMVGFASIGRLLKYPFLAAGLNAFLLGGALLSLAVALITMPIVLVAKSFTLTFLGVALLGTALIYGRRWLAARRAIPNTIATFLGSAAGLVLFVGAPALAQKLYDHHFNEQLIRLEASDPAIRDRELKSLVRSRFCWRACTRAVCEARALLDPATVKAVLDTTDVEQTCDFPDSNEWPG